MKEQVFKITYFGDKLWEETIAIEIMATLRKADPACYVTVIPDTASPLPEEAARKYVIDNHKMAEPEKWGEEAAFIAGWQAAKSPSESDEVEQEEMWDEIIEDTLDGGFYRYIS